MFTLTRTSRRLCTLVSSQGVFVDVYTASLIISAILRLSMFNRSSAQNSLELVFAP